MNKRISAFPSETPHLLSVWKQECRPTRKGWLEACSKTCFSVWTQSISWKKASKQSCVKANFYRKKIIRKPLTCNVMDEIARLATLWGERLLLCVVGESRREELRLVSIGRTERQRVWMPIVLSEQGQSNTPPLSERLVNSSMLAKCV